MKVGDKVRVVSGQYLEKFKGMTGEIVETTDDALFGSVVKFKEWGKGWNDWGRGWIDNDYWYLFLHDLEVVRIAPSKSAIRQLHPARTITPGARTILKHLRRRSISPVEAFSNYGTMRLAPRIHELRKAGFNIRTRLLRDEAGHQYARYSLAR
jgi:hypothetical protein